VSNRWWIYQRMRFPLLAHGPLIAVFSFSAVSFSSLLRGRVAPPDPATVLVAFATALLFFLQLRIADEFKDYEEDSRYRPYRPVQRGLVTLRELRIIGFAGAAIQLGLSIWLKPSLAFLLVGVWLYMGLMSKEFFVRDWLKTRPFAYMWTHSLIIPFIQLYVTACDWLAAGAAPPRGLIWFLAVGFFNGIVIEIGRKIRAPEDEEHGVETYSVLWGRRDAVLAWLGASLLTAASALLAANHIDVRGSLAGLVGVLLSAEAAIAWCFLRQPTKRRARLISPMSAVWTLFIYLGLGLLPLLLQA
jgi:hypothetical protein